MVNTKKILVISSIALLSLNTSYWFMEMWDDFMNDTTFDENLLDTSDLSSDFSDLEDSAVWVTWTNFETTNDWIVVVWEDWTLNLWVNAEVKKIVLNNAKSLTLWVNASAWTIEWTVEKADFWVNSEVNELYLKVDDLSISVNSDLKSGNIYVYKNFEWWVNAWFKWKMTVYWETSLSVNSEINWRYCSLWKVWLWVNSYLNTYSMEWLLWNIDPILNISTVDNDEDFSNVKTITSSFDWDFEDAMKKIDNYNTQINTLKSKISKALEENKASLQSELSSIQWQKATFKNETSSWINETFSSLKDYIDTDERNLELFENIKNIYIYTLDYENSSQVYNICNNSEVTGNINSTYEKNGKLYIAWKSFTRKIILPKSEIQALYKMMDKIPEEKIAKVNWKIDVMQEKIASKKKITKSDEKNLNMLMDVKELLRSEMLYE